MFWASIWYLDPEKADEGKRSNSSFKIDRFSRLRQGQSVPMRNLKIDATDFINIYNDEFLRFSWSGFLNQGVKLKLRTFLIQWCRNYSCIYLFFLLKIAALKNLYFFFLVSFSSKGSWYVADMMT